MNCMVSCAAHVLGCKAAEIYQGIGHGEPIHMSEFVAYFLTRGYGLTPYTKFEDIPFILLTESMLIEGEQANGTPHMVAVVRDKKFDPTPGDFYPHVYWVLVPTEVNRQYVDLHAERRDGWVREMYSSADLSLHVIPRSDRESSGLLQRERATPERIYEEMYRPSVLSESTVFLDSIGGGAAWSTSELVAGTLGSVPPAEKFDPLIVTC
jgi:hypothetical protein